MMGPSTPQSTEKTLCLKINCATPTIFLRQVTLFSRNVQAQPIFQDKLHFSQEMCNSIRFLETSCIFSEEMCNSNRFL
jgi:hypothetical protein